MSQEKEERSFENVRYEYEDVCENIRHYSNLRFAVFSVFSVVIGGMIAMAFSSGQFIANGSILAKVGGLLITLVFWNFEERVTDFLIYFQSRARELESLLNYSQISLKPRAKFPVFDTMHVVRMFFAILTVFWAYAFAASLTSP